MIFPDHYKNIKRNIFCIGDYKIIPIRYIDRIAIMQWRNEQIYHLRQRDPLTPPIQDKYFREVVSALFTKDFPEQFLFSYLKNEELVGYGGLVHINWNDRNAEISFLMDTSVESTEFHDHWVRFLKLISEVAFKELNFHKIYTYAFDLRPHLYTAVESSGFILDARLKEHFLFNNSYYDVIIHSKIMDKLYIRDAMIEDCDITYKWANDPVTRMNSFNSGHINYDDHRSWWCSKIISEKYYLAEYNAEPVGLIRFDRKEDYVIVGITIAPEFRGKGFSKKLIKMGCERSFSEMKFPIRAWIKGDNIASKKAFEGCGFTKIGEDFINGSIAYIYKFEQ